MQIVLCSIQKGICGQVEEEWEGTANPMCEVTETCDDAVTIIEGASRHLQSVQGLVTSSVLFPCF